MIGRGSVMMGFEKRFMFVKSYLNRLKELKSLNLFDNFVSFQLKDSNLLGLSGS